jgi:large subunit ribosomal protein L4
MQLELLNEQGQATSKVDAPDTVFARDYNEALVHQVVVAFQANARQGTRAQMDRGEVKHSTKKPFRQKGTGRARAGMTSSPLWRGGGRIFPNRPDENFSQKVNKKMYRAGMASILSQLARDGRLAVVDSIGIEAPKTKLLAAKFKAMGLDSVMVIADQIDDNLALASRNLANVLVVEPRYADPLSLVFFKKVLVTKGAIEQAQGDVRMSAVQKFDEGRLATVLVAPIISEKATRIAEKQNQVLFKVLRNATKPEIKAAVELMFKVEVESVQTVNQKGKTKRFGRSIGRRDHVKKAYVSLKPGQELNFSGEAA